MRGQDRIIAARLAGYAPSLVLMHVLDEQAWPAPDGSVDGYVQIGLGDKPDRLDLRFVVGLPVIVHGTDRARVAAVGIAAVASKAQGAIGFESSRPTCRSEDLVYAGGNIDFIGGARGDDHP